MILRGGAGAPAGADASGVQEAGWTTCDRRQPRVPSSQRPISRPTSSSSASPRRSRPTTRPPRSTTSEAGMASTPNERAGGGVEAAAVVDLRPGEPLPLEPGAEGPLVDRVQAHPEDLDAVRFVGLVETPGPRHLGPARGAPGGPEVDDDHPAPQGGCGDFRRWPLARIAPLTTVAALSPIRRASCGRERRPLGNRGGCRASCASSSSLGGCPEWLATRSGSRRTARGPRPPVSGDRPPDHDRPAGRAIRLRRASRRPGRARVRRGPSPCGPWRQ